MKGNRASRTAWAVTFVLAAQSQLLAEPPGRGVKGDDHGIRVARLVNQLGHDDFAARRAADRQLLQLGPDGRRQLEEAAASADIEISLRAKNLLERIAVVRLWAPSPISIKADGEKVAGVLAACASQSGNHIYSGDPYGEFKNVPVTVDFAERPYWQVLDELSQLTGNHPRMHYDNRTPGVVMASGPPGKQPTAYAGPVRAQITSARRVFIQEVDYEQPTSDVTHTFQLNLLMLWEDRFRLAAYGAQPEVIEAITDAGESVGATQASSGGWNVAQPGTRQVTAALRLNPPPAAAKSLKTLKLKWSLVALGDMAVAELENPAPKAELHAEGLLLSIVSMDRQPTGRVEMTLHVSRDIAVPEPTEILFGENEIELIDTAGRPMRPQSQNHTLGERGVEFRLAFLAESPALAPARLHFRYPKLRSRRDLEITFRNVPLPIVQPE